MGCFSGMASGGIFGIVVDIAVRSCMSACSPESGAAGSKKSTFVSLV